MPGWEWIALAYVSYLALVALARRPFTWTGALAIAMAVAGWALLAARPAFVASVTRMAPVAQAFVPLPVLISGYWLSGTFFVRPMPAIERWLRRVDERLLVGSGILDWYRAAPRWVHEVTELAYVLVYVVVPAGALIQALAGPPGSIARFWTVVLLATFTSYGMLPWIQTRPPRAADTDVAGRLPLTLFRRLNLAILHRGSIQVNTCPSGHAAGAVAVALAIDVSIPVAGAVFMALAVSISVATFLGRYHYLIDSVLGVLVGIAAWGLVGTLG